MKRESGFAHLMLLFLLVIGAVVGCFLLSKTNLLNHSQESKEVKLDIPKKEGKLAYITHDGELKERDYINQKEISLAKGINTSSKMLWSPLGKYILLETEKGVRAFDTSTQKEVNQGNCDFSNMTNVKWVGKTDTFSSVKDNKLLICDISKNENKEISIDLKGQVIDWLVINNSFFMYVDRVGQEDSIFLYSLNQRSNQLISTEKNITSTDGKYLWFAEDRNIAYLVPGLAKRIILDEQFNLSYISKVAIVGNYQVIGWDVGQCDYGVVFLPEHNFYIREVSAPAGELTVIGFEAPPKYAYIQDRYKLKSGETYWELAVRIFGDGNRWKEIYKVNEGKEPTNLQIASRIYLPEPSVRKMSDLQVANTPAGEIYFSPNQRAFPIYEGQFNKPLDILNGKLVLENKDSIVHYGSKYTIQNDPLLASTLKNNLLGVYQGDQKFDEIEGVVSSLWDWSNGFCWNNKYGDATPTAPDQKQVDECGTDTWLTSVAWLVNTCMDDFNYTSSNGVDTLINKKTGMKVVVSATKNEMPATGEDLVNRETVHYKGNTDGSTFTFDYPTNWGDDTKSVHVICSNASKEACTEFSKKIET